MKHYKTNTVELSLKRTVNQKVKNAKITCSKDSYTFIKQFYHDDIAIYESFFIVLLNRANNTTGYVKISQGGTAGTVVDLKIIAKYAIDSLSAGVILAHNHPSGNINPSSQDKGVTNQIKSGLKLFDINVVDHIILTEDKYFSFADEGEL